METNHMNSLPEKRRSSIVKWAVILGIAIVTNLFLTYFVRAIYNEPQYEDFCVEQQVNEIIETKEACLEVGGQWNENIDAKYPGQIEVMPRLAGYCDQQFTCRNQFEEVNRVYNRNVFIVFVVAGILLLIGSVFMVGAEAIALGLSFGGVLALIIGSMRYWSDMNDVLRAVILGIALLALLWVAYKKLQD